MSTTVPLACDGAMGGCCLLLLLLLLLFFVAVGGGGGGGGCSGAGSERGVGGGVGVLAENRAMITLFIICSPVCAIVL